MGWGKLSELPMHSSSHARLCQPGSMHARLHAPESLRARLHMLSVCVWLTRPAVCVHGCIRPVVRVWLNTPSGLHARLHEPGNMHAQLHGPCDIQAWLQLVCIMIA